MISLLRSPWPEHFDYLIGKASSSLVIASPYIGKGPCQRIISLKRKTTELREITILLVTDLSRETVLSGATDASAIYEMVGLFSQIEVRFLPSIHAKVYIADDQIAVVTSSNIIHLLFLPKARSTSRFWSSSLYQTKRVISLLKPIFLLRP
jgi:hypothetical protein